MMGLSLVIDFAGIFLTYDCKSNPVAVCHVCHWCPVVVDSVTWDGLMNDRDGDRRVSDLLVSIVSWVHSFSFDPSIQFYLHCNMTITSCTSFTMYLKRVSSVHIYSALILCLSFLPPVHIDDQSWPCLGPVNVQDGWPRWPYGQPMFLVRIPLESQNLLRSECKHLKSPLRCFYLLCSTTLPPHPPVLNPTPLHPTHEVWSSYWVLSHQSTSLWAKLFCVPPTVRSKLVILADD